MIQLPYGTGHLRLDPGSRSVRVAAPTRPGPAPPLPDLLVAALANPVGAAPLAAHSARRVLVVISDETRDEPRAEFLAAVAAALPAAELTIAIATGTHGPSRLEVGALLPGRRFDVVNHDGHDRRRLVSLGTTPRGTPVMVDRAVLEHDLIVATGCIRPHYFAGFGAGAKAIFPGLGGATEIRINHRLKTAAGARAGVVDGNPCRADLEDAVACVPTPTFLINGVIGADGAIHAVVAGALNAAFRAGAALAGDWFRVDAAPAPLVIVADLPPVTSSLYQASKLVANAAPLVLPGGALVMVAPCELGTGPLPTVMQDIFEIGIRPRLAPGVEVYLCSDLEPAVAGATYARAVAPADICQKRQGDILVLPAAASSLFM